ncbi:glycine zipper family protein [Desulfopila aestuarii]|uniref:Glycine zipper n=1 Tax=Desulfopila aestuarii DSM 18488 TaxID=1121416 RepID=A0A1M7Y1F5_9BACT|nr:glycine zipper family protein [Desulfopila aestuarii]SHO45597.1 Glycine zipper [Desulfopila aestuarii DSM 18488]
MKRVQMMLLAIFISFVSITNVNAGDKAVGGLLIGAGSGAIIGSAAGQNTESLLIGTAIGGAVGYAIGNSMEHPSHVVYQNTYRRPVVTHYHEYRPRVYYHRKPVHSYGNPYKPRYNYGRHDTNCRETVSYKKDRGRVSKVVKTTCNTPRLYDRDNSRSRWHR